MKKILSILFFAALLQLSQAEDTFKPYSTGDVPQSVTELWKDFDPAKDPLDVKVVREWKADGIVTRYITFTVCIVKGVKSRIAAYYSFPDNGMKNPAFVWSHGGGQRAERNRGIYFAKQGYATVDINWLGRPMEKDIEENTDWGKVDPTQGERFYSKALRKSVKINLQPDEHTIDPVVSPRNGNWFLLAVAGRRAITFLENQAEVDAGKLGFAGYSMGGMVTALNSIDPRLKAVVPFVGGSAFKHIDLPGVPFSGVARQYKDIDLYSKTIDPCGYWPLVKCPVMFITSSNDFHSVFERIYKSMALLKHSNWRVSSNIHANHGPSPEEWVNLNLWFDHYLKGTGELVPKTPESSFTLHGTKGLFKVNPYKQEKLQNLEVYYSYDPNARIRFWKKAALVKSGKSWSAQVEVPAGVPIHIFALCRYNLGKKRLVQYGETETFTLNSKEHVIIPENYQASALKSLKKTTSLIEDFKSGLQDWHSRAGRTISTYKFQNPEFDLKSGKKLKVTVDPKGKTLVLAMVADARFHPDVRGHGDMRYSTVIKGTAPQEIVVDISDFKSQDGVKLEWSQVAKFSLSLRNTSSKGPIDLRTEEGLAHLKSIELVD